MDYHTLKDIPMYPKWAKIEPLLKGWSEDKKFYIEDYSGERFLLRLSDISKYEGKRLDFEYMKKIANLGISMTRPIDFGTCAEGQMVYILLTWLDGEDGEIALPKLDEKTQYQLGRKAGEILRKIHSIPAEATVEDWAERYKRKIQKRIQIYNSCPIRLDNDNAFISFLEENMIYLEGRPQTFQHGDFHLGNLIVCNGTEIGVIDFNRADFGDPWEEFNRCTFSWKVSVPFIVGQIHGYFNDAVPDEFFRLMALYFALNTISSIPWAIPFGESEIEYMLSNAKAVFEYYNGFKTYIPTWYKSSM